MNSAAEARTTAYHLVMCSFQGAQTASSVTSRLKAEGGLAGCEIEGEAMVWRDAAGRVRFREKGSAGVGAAVGATTAGMLGLIGGPVVLPLMVAAGTLVGGVAGHYAGQVLPPEDLRRVGESLPPGSSAYLALVDTAHAAGVAGTFAAEGAQVLDMPVETELSCAIRETVTHSIGRA